MVFLSDLRPIDVGPTHTQAHGAAWLSAASARIHGANSREAIRAAALYRRLDGGGSIGSRQSCVPDYQSLDPATWRLFSPASGERWWEASLQRRMAIYQKTAFEVAERAYADRSEVPAAIMQVTCTGYEAPTAVQRLVAAKGWGEATRSLQLGHMGCFAAVPACRLAATMAASPESAGRSVSVLHVELCTVHLAPEAIDPEQIVVHHLFADGAVRYELSAHTPKGAHFSLLDSFELILDDSAEAMTWRLTDTGFRMSLSQDVPARVAGCLPGVVSGFLAKHGLRREHVARWAIHPGGPKIIDGVAACLEIEGEERLRHSRHVLRTRGNMSSATLPHVWRDLAVDPAVSVGDHVVSIAFGPGLTVTGNLLRKEA